MNNRGFLETLVWICYRFSDQGPCGCDWIRDNNVILQAVKLASVVRRQNAELRGQETYLKIDWTGRSPREGLRMDERSLEMIVCLIGGRGQASR